MKTRTRVILGPVNHRCGLCGADQVILVRSHRIRRLQDRLSPSWDPEVRLTELCTTCGARIRASVDSAVNTMAS